jgi:hypothetical protein
LVALLSKENEKFVLFMAAVVLFLLGYAHMAKFGFGFSQFKDSFREYALICAAGGMFGWLLLESARGYREKLFFSPSPSLFPSLETLGVLSAPVFLVVLHQFRYFLNDGPANIATGLVLLAYSVFSKDDGARKTSEIADGEADLAVIRLKFSNEGYSVELLKRLAEAHKKHGNHFKSKFVNDFMEEIIKRGETS